MVCNLGSIPDTSINRFDPFVQKLLDEKISTTDGIRAIISYGLLQKMIQQNYTPPCYDSNDFGDIWYFIVHGDNAYYYGLEDCKIPNIVDNIIFTEFPLHLMQWFRENKHHITPRSAGDFYEMMMS